MSDAKVAFYRSIGLTGSLPDMERDFFEGSYRKVPYVLAQSAVPVCLAPNGTVATNGIVTLGTALPATYSGGIWLRLPANAVVGGSSGLYWAVMSSTTQGQVYTNFYNPATQFIPSIPSGTLVAAVGSNAAYTQSTAADITLVNITVEGGSMGVNGGIREDVWFSHSNSAGTKTLKILFGSGTVLSHGVTTTATTRLDNSVIRNRGVADKQYMVSATNSGVLFGGTSTSSSATTSGLTVDTSSNVSLTFVGNLAVATDFIIVESSIVEIQPS